MLSTYLVAIHTGVDYDGGSYDAAAGRMLHVLTEALTKADSLAELTGNAALQGCHAEVEIGLEDAGAGRELIGKAVLDLTADDKVKLDKGKLTKVLKRLAETEEWPLMKINKKAVIE
tara:strand:- start:3722 stop:4072 length:351 start_codon:yes stop_codon:yes gene_type:complete